MYVLRVCGSNDFVSKINPNDTSCYPPGSVEYVPYFKTWAMKKYPTRVGAERAAKLVGKLDGVHCDVENVD